MSTEGTQVGRRARNNPKRTIRRAGLEIVMRSSRDYYAPPRHAAEEQHDRSRLANRIRDIMGLHPPSVMKPVPDLQ